MPNAIRTMLVGVASTHELDPVLPAALDLARQLGATLHVAHVFELPEPALAARVLPDAAAVAAYRAALTAELTRRLEQQAAAFSEGVQTHCHVREGCAHRRLAGLAAEVGADLLLVGATRRGRIWRNILGTTAERVLGHASVPVLVMHQPFYRPVRRVLLTTDLSCHSRAVHEDALAVLATVFGRPELRLLLVVGSETELPPPLEPEALMQAARAELEHFAAAQHGPVPLNTSIRSGEPAREILLEAAEWEADLVVLGSYGRDSEPPAMVGTIAAGVVRGASCNVLVVPSAAAGERRPVREAQEAELVAGSPC